MVEKKTKTKKIVKGIEVTLTPNSDIPQKRTYSNFIQVAQTPYDFSLMFCDATPISTGNNTDEKIIHDIPIVAEIVIPFQLVPGFIKALQVQYSIYKDNIDGDVNVKKSSKS